MTLHQLRVKRCALCGNKADLLPNPPLTSDPERKSRVTICRKCARTIGYEQEQRQEVSP
jgi:hypothetical protein